MRFPAIEHHRVLFASVVGQCRSTCVAVNPIQCWPDRFAGLTLLRPSNRFRTSAKITATTANGFANRPCRLNCLQFCLDLTWGR